MQEKDCVIILRKGKEVLALPGSGGYKIEWSPGTKLMPMTSAPSGHLVIPCDDYHKLKETPNLKENITFVTDHTTASWQ